MAAPFAQLTIGTPGVGGAHASYITRMSALDPNRPIDPANDQHPTRLQELDQDDSTVQQTLAETLDVHALDLPTKLEQSEPAADPVWTWNAPPYLTDDNYGIQQLSHSDGNCECLSPNPENRIREPISQFRLPWAPPDVKENDRKLFRAMVFDKPLSNIYSVDRELRLKEKADNLRTYFGSKEDFEKAKGGRTHYKVKLSFDVPATNQQIRELTNVFLEQTFPRSIAFAAIHRDTDHPHVHLYLHSRQIDGKRIQLKNNDYRSVDEKWARIYSDFAGDRSIYVEHLRKKEETREWKIAAAEAYQKGQPVPPKPERDSDRREKLAERRLSAQRSKARDQGQKLEPRPQAEPVIRPASEKETGRLLAKHEVAQERLDHLIRTDALQTQIYWAGRIAHEVADTLDKTIAARKEMNKGRLPAVVYTIEETKEIKGYTSSRGLALTDDHAAARLQATRVVFAAELKDAQSKAEAFQASRHFWKLDVPGWERGLSLKEVEDKIKLHTDEKFRLYNFLRPTKRESIQNSINYFQETKKDIQNQLAAKELPIQKNLSTAQLTYDTASRLIESTEKARAAHAKDLPAPLFYKQDLARLHEIAHRNKDAQLLSYLYEQVKDHLLANPSQETLSRLKRNAIIAKMEMMKEADRLQAAVEFRDFRRLPLRDAEGLDYTRSLREVQPKNALELLIRNFTDTNEHKQEGKALAEASAQQLQRAEAQYRKAKEWSLTSDKIAQDHYRAARVPEKQIAPRLTAEQIDQLRQYAESLPFLSPARKQFKDAARMAEGHLQRTGAAHPQGRAHQSRSSEPSAGAAEQSPSEITRNTSVPARPNPQLPETHPNDHQTRAASPATEAQQTNIKHVPTELDKRSLSPAATAAITPELLRRDPKAFANAVEIANNNRDAKLLSQLYDIAKDKLLKQLSPESLSYLKAQAILARMEMLQHAQSLGEAYRQHRVIPPPHDAPNRLAGLPAEVRIAEQEHAKARDWSLIRDRIVADRFKAAGVVESRVVPDLDRQQITQLTEFANTLPELSMFRKEFTEAAIIAEQALLQREAAQAAERESQMTRLQDRATRDKESSTSRLGSTRDRDR